MRVTKVIPYRYWKHVSGRIASIHGSCPYTSEREKQDWTIETKGYTWEVIDSRGNVTYGLCRVPAKTLEEANEIMERYNANK